MMDQISHRHFALGLAAVAAAALTAALIGQYAFGLAPCVLCIYQRIPYAVIVALGLLAWFVIPTRFAKTVLILCVFALLAEFALAVFHVGVEQTWWEGTQSCQINLKGATLEEIRERIMNAPKALCTDVAWSLFGISMAGYNALMSLGLLVISSVYLVHRK